MVNNLESDLVSQEVTAESGLKEILINYIGETNNPDNGEITVGMIVDIMAEQFPEFLMVIAEENWVRGYKQALNDVAQGEQLSKKENEKLLETN